MYHVCAHVVQVMAETVAGGYYLFREAYVTLGKVMFDGIAATLSTVDAKRLEKYVMKRDKIPQGPQNQRNPARWYTKLKKDLVGGMFYS
jgi:hypothetical protein